jgi:nitrite reductase/ring-hydroxylating ferredoxin subunit
VCPVHFWTYNLQTGQNINQKQGIKSLNSYKIFEKDGIVYLEDPKIDLPKWRLNNPETT